MLATLALDIPSKPDQFSFEYKWDGVRAISYHDGRKLRVFSRNNREITSNYPELEQLARALGDQRVILDGEIVALNENDRPSFPKLQRRMHVRAPSDSLQREVPIWYVLFDILNLDGRSLLAETYETRRELLEETTLAGAYWRVTPAYVGEGAAMLETARANGLEGLVAKRLNSTYEPGRRSPDWLKLKVVQSQEFVVGGWIEETGSTGDRVGSMIFGYYDCAGKLHFAGSVGSGYDAREHERLVKKLVPLTSDKSPFAERIPRRTGGRVVRFVKPQLVIQVEYRRWPEGGSVQQASYQGLRADKEPREVVKERSSMQGTMR